MRENENVIIEDESHHHFRARRGTDESPYHAKRRQSVPENEVSSQRREKKYDYQSIVDERPIKSSGVYNLEQNFEPVKLIKKQEEKESSQFAEELKENSRTRNHSFDEIPISGRRNKRFEDLLDEELRNNPAANNESTSPKTGRDNSGEKKIFLKKKSNLFLASAANRSLKYKFPQHNQSMEIGNFISPKANSYQTFFSQSKRTIGSNNESNVFFSQSKIFINNS